MTPKEAHERRNSDPIYWFECPICERFEAHHEKPDETCSEICQEKLDKARKRIEKNNWAEFNDLVDHGKTIKYIFHTNCDAVNVAKGVTDFHYLLGHLDDEGLEFHAKGEMKLEKAVFE